MWLVMAVLLVVSSAEGLALAATARLPLIPVPRWQRGHGLRMQPDVDLDGNDSWDDQLAEQAQWFAGQQTDSRGGFGQQRLPHNVLETRHDELSLLRQASWMAEQQIHGTAQAQQQMHEAAPSQMQAPSMSQNLAADWYQSFDQLSGQVYYCHEQTDQCQWELPQPAYPQPGGS